ncbi:hypothetical protein [Chryseobacterium sp. KCF3-3]|uniref:hypothetical protein n=1 Tax=Chryseobacterium sp. KCF3-3 TaxID=3231511 RepID=UPI0038B258A4
MVNINGYIYDYAEIIEALQKKGYIVICEEHNPDKRGNIKREWHAFKAGESPNPLNTMESVALKEFHKKPPLN